MTRLDSVKAGSRLWPVLVFYNVMGMILLNNWVIHKIVWQRNTRRSEYI